VPRIIPKQILIRKSEKNIIINEKMSELNPLVRWLLFIYYIAIGSAQILIVKLTMEGGKIRYNT